MKTGIGVDRIESRTEEGSVVEPDGFRLPRSVAIGETGVARYHLRCGRFLNRRPFQAP
jgi:hypothetical protein